MDAARTAAIASSIDCSTIPTHITLEVKDKQFHLQYGQIYLVGKISETEKGDLKNFIQFPGESSVDSKHATLEVHQSPSAGISVVDLHSSTNTHVNGLRIDPLQKIQVREDTSLRFGNEECSLKVSATIESPNSSGFQDSTKNIYNTSLSPDAIVVGNQNSTSIQGSFSNSINKDSFTIPDTQCADGMDKRVSLIVEKVSTAGAGDSSCFDDTDEDSFIPETQEIVATSQRLLHCSRTEESNNAEKEHVETTALAESQFRICTQDFNDNCFDGGFGTELDGLINNEEFSQVIPHILHPPEQLINVQQQLQINQESAGKETLEDSTETFAEMSALNWTNSNCNKDNNTGDKLDAERESDTCTPDLFDLPDLAEENMKKNNKNIDDNAHKSAEEVEKENEAANFENIEHPTNVQKELISGPKSSETVKDSMPICIVINEAGKPSSEIVPTFLLPNASTRKESKVLSTADTNSDDEEDLMQTQVFAVKSKSSINPEEEVPLTLSGKENLQPEIVVLDCSKQVATKSILDKTASSRSDAEEDVSDDFAATQAFPTRNPKLATTTLKKCLNSTLPQYEGSSGVRNAASFFSDMKKTQHLVTPQRKSSSTQHASSVTVGQLSEASYENMMCTPKFIKDQFDTYLASSSTNVSDPEKKTEENDLCYVLDIENVPKISNDFDLLMSHLNSETTKRKANKEECDRKKEDAKRKQRTSHTESKSRDERHVSRDKTKEAEKIDKLRNGKQTDSSQKEKQKERKNIELNKTAEMEQKVKECFFVPNGKPANGPKKDSKTERAMRKSKESVHPEEIFKQSDSKTEHSKSKKPSKKELRKDTQKELPTRRVTRLLSRKEEGQEKIQQRSEYPSTAKSMSGPISSSSSTRSNTKGDRKSAQELDKEPLATLSRRASRSRSIQESIPVVPQARKEETIKEKVQSKNHLTHRLNASSDRGENDKELPDKKKINSSKATEEPLKLQRKRKMETAQGDKRKRLRSAEDPSKPVSSSSSALNTKSTIRLKIATTMVEPKLFESLEKNSAGIWSVTKDPAECDVLIMDKGNRTYKFLIAMARGIPILTSKWLECLNKTHSIPRNSEFIFTDSKFEKRHKFTLIKSLEAARKKTLFEGYEFLMTPNILPTPDEIRNIINCAGGKVLAKATAERPNQKIYLLSTGQDKALWHQHRRLNSRICIINTEGIMAAVTRQNVAELDYHPVV